MKNECLFYAKFSILWVLVLSGELRVHFFVEQQRINENEDCEVIFVHFF